VVYCTTARCSSTYITAAMVVVIVGIAVCMKVARAHALTWYSCDTVYIQHISNTDSNYRK
jgi:hypothetical protein